MTEKLVTSACCNRQHAHAYLHLFPRKTGQQRWNNDFYRGTVLWCPRAQVSLNLENRDLDCRNLRSIMKISFAVFPCLSQLVLAQFALEMCLAARNRQKIHKTTIFGVQGHPRSLNSVAIESQCTTFYYWFIVN